MTILEVLTAPDPRLKEMAEPVSAVDEAVRKLMDDMWDTMNDPDAPGIGLAATQVGVAQRVLVMNVDRDLKGNEIEGKPYYMANPEIIWESEDEFTTYNEGCLSVPEHYAEIERPAKVRMKYLDYDGNEQEEELDELRAICVQHEIDHLNGVLFIDHVSSLKRNMIIRKLKKAKKDAVIL